MPIYEYKCEKCEKHHEVMQKITEDPLSVCPNCGGSVKKMISNTSFVLKGTGWYATDYTSKGKEEKKESTAPSVTKEVTNEAKKAETAAASSDTKKESTKAA